MESKSAELAISFESIQNKEKDTSELANQLNTSYRENNYLQKQIESLTSIYDARVVDYEYTITQLKTHLTSLQSSHDSLQVSVESLNEFESTAAELSKTIQMLRSELNLLNQKERQWIADKSHLETTIQDRVIENASLREKATEQSSQMTSLTSTMAALGMELEALHQSKDSLESNHSIQLTAMQLQMVFLE